MQPIKRFPSPPLSLCPRALRATPRCVTDTELNREYLNDIPTLRKVDFFGWWLEQQQPIAGASFSAEKIRLSELDSLLDRCSAAAAV